MAGEKIAVVARRFEPVKSFVILTEPVNWCVSSTLLPNTEEPEEKL